MKNQEFRKYPDDRYLALTGDCPPNLPSLFIGFSGDTPDDVKEVVIPGAALPDVATDVPEKWKVAFRSYGFTFEEEASTPARDEELDNLRRQIEVEKLVRQLVELRAPSVPTIQYKSSDIPFRHFVALSAAGVAWFAAILWMIA